MVIPSSMKASVMIFFPTCHAEKNERFFSYLRKLNLCNKFCLRAVPFKSTWEEEGNAIFLFYLLVVGVKPYFFYVGWVFFLLVGEGGLK